MPRVKIVEPEQYYFTTSYTIAITDVNYGGHLGNDRVLSIVHEARFRFYKWLGLSEMNIGAGIGTMMADSAIQYKSEGFAGDEIRIKVGVSDIGRVGFDIHYQLMNVSKGKLLAVVKTGIVCYDYSLKKLASVPDSFVNAINKVKK